MSNSIGTATPSTTLELPLFTCLMDMVALEQGLFCDNRDHRRLRLAQNNLLYGLRLADGSIFKYSYADGPTVTVDMNQCLKSAEKNEKPSENPSIQQYNNMRQRRKYVTDAGHQALDQCFKLAHWTHTKLKKEERLPAPPSNCFKFRGMMLHE